mmetsp:Transcript_14181/g.23298  ORF Transcript_14181/g.23298 Transcript_14181/m.23298 type:complete len:82 (-) Transcript_14181:65-310(-)|eukprot:scaffold30677_cov166-Skeletonema_menzelii.AAC.2
MHCLDDSKDAVWTSLRSTVGPNVVGATASAPDVCDVDDINIILANVDFDEEDGRRTKLATLGRMVPPGRRSKKRVRRILGR